MAEELSPGLSQAQLDSMGLGSLRPLSAAEGHQVRGTRAIWNSFNAVGIPLGIGGGSRLVAILNWAYHPHTPDVPTLIWRQMLKTRQYTEAVPPGPREF